MIDNLPNGGYIPALCWHDGLARRNRKAKAVAEYRVKRPGDVLELNFTVHNCEPGYYVLLSIDDFCTLAVLGENDDGNLCATTTQIIVSDANLSLFDLTDLEVCPI
jgi:hypothetical protein